MKLSAASIILISVATTSAFVPSTRFQQRAPSAVYNYFDDLGKNTADLDAEEEEVDDSIAATNLANDKFDGGDGQMGVAGDGEQGLAKIGYTPSFAASKMMSAKNAWGTSSGYGEELRAQGVETSRAQQLENWHNQQEVLKKKNQQRDQAAAYDTVTTEDENWRALAKFGVERNQEFDMTEAFGETASVGEITETIELHTRVNTLVYHEFSLKNDFMGFADFRAAFTTDTKAQDWTVEPTEGSLSKEPINFIVKFRPSQPGVSEGYLVIETEDLKKTYKLVGNTA